MISRMAIALVLVAGSASAAPAQQEPPVDSLIAHWIDQGSLARWTPANLFEGCPDLAEWQQRGIRRVLELDLTVERTSDLGFSWAFPLRECRDPRLEQWYFGRLDEAVARGDWSRMDGLRAGVDLADSPRIRAYLRNLMLNMSLPADVRNTAGVFYFEKLGPGEYRREFLRAFETLRLPWERGWAMAYKLLRQDPDRLLREVAPLVRANPALANQSAFSEIVQAGYDLASDEARTELADALEAGLNAAGGGMPEALRQRLDAKVQDLRRRHRGSIQ